MHLIGFNLYLAIRNLQLHMLKVSLPVGEDLLEIHHNMWTGKDQVFWNGESVSLKRRFFGSTHVFRVANGLTGHDDVFRVKIGMGFNGTTYGVKRNERVLLGTWSDKLTHNNRGQMPEIPGLDLNNPPPRQRREAPEPLQRQDWSDEDLIV
jgi:hypothetical protein